MYLSNCTTGRLLAVALAITLCAFGVSTLQAKDKDHQYNKIGRAHV